ncbi:hypothetical protein MTR67_039559 [Solanum verrucosum]|uniref:Uncharacterized protein n=1 Tax=Solanum verrucosum TaxID=315347 RepID=A0AAF0ZRA6_SOLVR|nr:hypothetical protein MTR67_039559 [Solanum verrucosum]
MIKVTINDRVELTSYLLKDVAHIWFTRYDRPSSYAFQIKTPRKAYPRNANAHNTNVVPIVPNHRVSNVEFRSTIQLLVQCVTNQKNHQALVPTNNNFEAAAARVQDFVRINSPEFLGSQVGEDPRTSFTRYDLPSSYAFQIKPPRKAYPRNSNSHNANEVPPVLDYKVSNVEFRNTIQLLVQSWRIPKNFIDVVKKINGTMKLTINDWVEFTSCQLKDVPHIWYDLHSSYAFRIKPPRKAYPRNANANNSNAIPPNPDHNVSNVEFQNTL